MTETEETKPTPPHGARLLEIGETIQDGDLHWNSTEKHWLAVTPPGEEKVEPGHDSRLVGVVSGEEEIDFLWWTVEKDNVMAGGSGFTSLAAWGRSNWPL